MDTVFNVIDPIHADQQLVARVCCSGNGAVAHDIDVTYLVAGRESITENELKGLVEVDDEIIVYFIRWETEGEWTML